MPLSRWKLLALAISASLLSGCFRPWTYPGAYGYGGYGGYGYGAPSYGGYPVNGGYQGIQTLTPGQYYDPALGGTPTYAPATINGIQPEPDSRGSSGSGDGGNAPTYSPDASPSKPVPEPRESPLYDGSGGAGPLDPPVEGGVQENKIPLDEAPNGASLERPRNWAEGASEPIRPAGHSEEAADSEAMVPPQAAEPAPLSFEATESAIPAEEPSEEAPPLAPGAP